MKFMLQSSGKFWVMYKVFVLEKCSHWSLNYHPFKICSHDYKPDIQFNRHF